MTKTRIFVKKEEYLYVDVNSDVFEHAKEMVKNKPQSEFTKMGESDFVITGFTTLEEPFIRV